MSKKADTAKGAVVKAAFHKVAVSIHDAEKTEKSSQRSFAENVSEAVKEHCGDVRITTTDAGSIAADYVESFLPEDAKPDTIKARKTEVKSLAYAAHILPTLCTAAEEATGDNWFAKGRRMKLCTQWGRIDRGKDTKAEPDAEKVLLVLAAITATPTKKAETVDGNLAAGIKKMFKLMPGKRTKLYANMIELAMTMEAHDAVNAEWFPEWVVEDMEKARAKAAKA